uniref:3'-5' exonuclease domain-containing protein n=1 Tax=Oryza barthii TaxID=65489 RepID=A0A0D3ES36_9ORYZ
MGGGSGVGDEEAEAEAAAAAEVTGRGGARGDVGGGGGGAGEAAAAVRTGGERRRRCGRVGGVEIPGGVGSQLAANSEVNDSVVPANSEVRLRFQVACLSGSVSTGGLIVGIDTEWRTDHLPAGKTCYKVAVLQLCVGRRCLVFQIYQAGNMVPHELAEFLADPSVRFVGVAVNNDVQRLANDCNLRVACAVDLRYAAAAVLGQPELARAGLKRLALTVMGAHMEKEKNITKSR